MTVSNSNSDGKFIRTQILVG